jgi:hypothetical protein
MSFDATTLTAVAACVAAGAALFGAAKGFFNARGIQELKVSINHRFDAFVAASVSQALKDGAAQARADDKLVRDEKNL